jgi:DNA polymerase III sliding clamp (beta) subunit (PCNA family)
LVDQINGRNKAMTEEPLMIDRKELEDLIKRAYMLGSKKGVSAKEPIIIITMNRSENGEIVDASVKILTPPDVPEK